MALNNITYGVPMENKLFKSFVKILLTFLSIFFSLQLMSCEDDAILEPQPTDDCTGSYCNLSLPSSQNYAQLKITNPSIY